MMRRSNGRTGRWGLVALFVLGLAAGCKQDAPPLPKPDPDALRKEQEELNRQRMRERSKVP
jgi:hypothetical protein